MPKCRNRRDIYDRATSPRAAHGFDRVARCDKRTNKVGFGGYEPVVHIVAMTEGGGCIVHQHTEGSELVRCKGHEVADLCFLPHIGVAEGRPASRRLDKAKSFFAAGNVSV